MAAVGTNTLTSLSRRYLFGKIIDIVYGSNAIFYRLNQGRRREIPGGYQMETGVLHRKSTIGGPFQGWDPVTIAEQDNIINAVYEWKQQYQAVSVNKLQLIKAASPEAKFNYLSAQFEQAEMDLADKMGTGLQSDGTDAKQIAGMKVAVDDGGVNSTYAGVSRTTYPGWASTDNSTSGTLTNAVLRSLFLSCKSGGRSPTLIYSEVTQYGRFLALGEAAQDYPVGAGGHDTQLLSAGFDNALFMQVPWVEDSHTFAGANASNSAILMLNEFYISLGVNPGADFTMSPFESARVAGQLGWVSTIDWAGELIVEHPGRQGKLTNITA
jgi:hypothetical protein